MNELIEKVVQWHIDRNLIDGATDESQFKKLMSEFGEYSDNLSKGACVKDDIGDMGVVLINIAARNNLVPCLECNSLTVHNPSYHELHYSMHELGYYIECELKEYYVSTLKENIVDAWETLSATATANGHTMQVCLEHAYDDIKDRRGKMINGTFVKE